MSSSPILHVAEKSELSFTDGLYYPDAFSENGFTHCCSPDQLKGVLSRYYEEKTGLILLVINPDEQRLQIRFEDTTGSGEKFPHIYAGIPQNLILNRAELPDGEKEREAFLMNIQKRLNP